LQLRAMEQRGERVRIVDVGADVGVEDHQGRFRLAGLRDRRRAGEQHRHEYETRLAHVNPRVVAREYIQPRADSQRMRAWAAITSGRSSGQKSFAFSSRRTPRELPKARARWSAPAALKIVSSTPQITRTGTRDSRSAGPMPASGLCSSATAY